MKKENKYAEVGKWLKRADCKSAALGLRTFESYLPHHNCMNNVIIWKFAIIGDSDGLENRCPEKDCGFESHSFRHPGLVYW